MGNPHGLPQGVEYEGSRPLQSPIPPPETVLSALFCRPISSGQRARPPILSTSLTRFPNGRQCASAPLLIQTGPRWQDLRRGI